MNTKQVSLPNNYSILKVLIIPHKVVWVYFKMNCHQNMKLHNSFIYLYHTKILIHIICLNIKVFIQLNFLSVATLYNVNTWIEKKMTNVYIITTVITCVQIFSIYLKAIINNLQSVHCEKRSVRFYVSYMLEVTFHCPSHIHE